MLRELGRIALCSISCALLVLLVPSSAWSADGDTPASEPSPSSSLASASESPSVEPTPSASDSPSAPPSSSSESAPAGESPAASDAPTATETVYVVTDPPAPTAEPSSVTLEGDEPVVALSDADRALLGLVGCFVALGVGARIVGSFA